MRYRWRTRSPTPSSEGARTSGARRCEPSPGVRHRDKRHQQHVNECGQRIEERTGVHPRRKLGDQRGDRQRNAAGNERNVADLCSRLDMEESLIDCEAARTIGAHRGAGGRKSGTLWRRSQMRDVPQVLVTTRKLRRSLGPRAGLPVDRDRPRHVVIGHHLRDRELAEIVTHDESRVNVPRRPRVSRSIRENELPEIAPGSITSARGCRT